MVVGWSCSGRAHTHEACLVLTSTSWSVWLGQWWTGPKAISGERQWRAVSACSGRQPSWRGARAKEPNAAARRGAGVVGVDARRATMEPLVRAFVAAGAADSAQSSPAGVRLLAPLSLLQAPAPQPDTDGWCCWRWAPEPRWHVSHEAPEAADGVAGAQTATAEAGRLAALGPGLPRAAPSTDRPRKSATCL